MGHQGDDAGVTTLACPPEGNPQCAVGGSWSAPSDVAGAPAMLAPSWFALRVTLIELLRRSFFAAANPWVPFGSVTLPGGGFVRWHWFDEVGAPVRIEINPGQSGPAGVGPEQMIERLVMLGWNMPRHPSPLCWLEAPRPEMWLHRDQRQRFADTADRIILTLTVVLGLAPTDIATGPVAAPLD